MIPIERINSPVSLGSTLGGVMIVNSLKVVIASFLHNDGKTPKVQTSDKIIGVELATELFESAYDEHAHNMSKLYANIGNPKK